MHNLTLIVLAATLIFSQKAPAPTKSTVQSAALHARPKAKPLTYSDVKTVIVKDGTKSWVEHLPSKTVTVHLACTGPTMMFGSGPKGLYGSTREFYPLDRGDTIMILLDGTRTIPSNMKVSECVISCSLSKELRILRIWFKEKKEGPAIRH
jgi:hypothetical protein